MKIEIDSIEFNIIVEENDLSSDKIPLVFLHGFTGSAKDWLFLFDKLPEKFLPVAIDLIGHGQSAAPEDINYYSPNSIASQLKKIFDSFNWGKIILTGYSMGGRAALCFASNFPEMLSGLILESTSTGFEKVNEKKERIENDYRLADKIEKQGIKYFINYWMDIPLFHSLQKLPKEKYKSLIKTKQNNTAVGLANMLKGFSTGTINISNSFLRSIDFPVLLITGELDNKFTIINKKLKDIIPDSNQEIILNVGHNTHLEDPEKYISIVNKYLENFFNIVMFERKKRKRNEI